MRFIINVTVLSDLRQAQMKRSALEKVCTEPFLPDFIGQSSVPDPDRPHNLDYDCILPGLFCRILCDNRTNIVYVK